MSAASRALATIRLGDFLEEFDERLGTRAEPEVLTLTEKNGFVSQRQRFRKRLAVDDTSGYRVIRRHDIAFNPYLLWAGAIGQNNDWDMAIVSPLYPTFHVRDGYDPRFVNYVLHESGLYLCYERISFGSVPRKRRAAVQDFLNLLIPQPPLLGEQRRIARILDNADTLRAKRRAALRQIDTLAQAIFLDMFGDRSQWPLVSLDSICRMIRDGTHKTPSYMEAGVPFITVKNIVTGSMNLKDVKYISLEEHKFLTRRVNPERGDILVSKDGTIGVACPVETDVVFSIFVSVALLKLQPSLVDQTFLVWQFRAPWLQSQIHDRTKGIAIRHLHLIDFKQLSVVLPPLSVQRQFVRRVAAVERLRSAQGISLTKMEALFASLQYRAFRGEL